MLLAAQATQRRMIEKYRSGKGLEGSGRVLIQGLSSTKAISRSNMSPNRHLNQGPLE